MSFTPEQIKAMAAELFRKEQAERKAEEEKILAGAVAAEAALREAERLARIRAEQEREEARIRAERALAEEKVRAEAAALKVALEAELTRLRNRTEVEVLRDEVAELRKQLETYKAPSYTIAVQTPSFPGSKWMGYLKGKPSEWGWVDPTPGSQKELWITYKDYTSGVGVEHQVKFSEIQEIQIQAINMEVVKAIWRGKVFGGRIEGFGPRTVPLSSDNPYQKTWNPACPLGEIDVTGSLQQRIVICSWH
jgi:hypothetical protein